MTGAFTTSFNVLIDLYVIKRQRFDKNTGHGIEMHR